MKRSRPKYITVKALVGVDVDGVTQIESMDQGESRARKYISEILGDKQYAVHRVAFRIPLPQPSDENKIRTVRETDQ